MAATAWDLVRFLLCSVCQDENVAPFKYLLEMRRSTGFDSTGSAVSGAVACHRGF